MVNNLVNIILKSTVKGGGLSDTIDDAKRLTELTKGLSDSFKKLGVVFGTVGGSIGNAIGNLIKGGIWGAATEFAKVAIEKTLEWWRAEEEAAKKVAEADRKLYEERTKAVSEFVDVATAAYQKTIASSNENLKLINEEISATKELARATLEYNIEQERKAGNVKEVGRLQKRLGGLDARYANASLVAQMDNAKEQEAAARARADKLVSGLAVAQKVADDGERALAAKLQEVRAGAENAVVWHGGSMHGFGGGVYGMSPEESRAAGDAAVAQYAKTEEYQQLKEASEKSAAAYAKMVEDIKKAQEDEAKAVDKQSRIQKQMDANGLREETRKIKAEQDAADARVAAEKKAAEDRRKAALAAEQEAARAREQYEREAHQRRISDLRTEMAEQSKAAQSLRAVATRAQTEFDRAFSMYRDPARATSEIAEERSYAADYRRLGRDAARYGGKWRIDELSRLMAAGDTQGVSDTLEGWRKSKSFTPQIEAMVRASAADRTRTTVEDELRKIEGNTKDLADRVEQLLAMKGGE